MCGRIALLTVGAAMNPIEVRMPMTEATRLREPMTRVPVFKEVHPQKFESFGSFDRLVSK